MNLDEYEKIHRPTYADFANVVRFLLEQAIAANQAIRQPHTIQARAKGVASLRRRLEETNKLDTQTLETDRRDLAGTRLVFYTNNDVDRFLGSGLIRENFEIEEDSTRVHHPTPENEGLRYRAIHFTVRLKDDRARLSEYTRFAGLRCEIQVQTILNHAWAETSHDITYKGNLGVGFGQRAMQSISRRFDRIMDRYLIPAGYEIQKAQQDYERVVQGRALFDQDVVQLLERAQSNNERYEILSGLKDYVIPSLDDLPAVYAQLRPAFLRTVQAARVTAPVPISTSFGEMKGFKSEMVAHLVVEIVGSIRYADAVGTLQLLMDLHRGETNERIRSKIVEVTKHLAEYDIHVYEKVGPHLQLALIDYLAGLKTDDIDAAWDVALAVWSECLQSDITASDWAADSMVLRRGSVPISPPLREVRDKAIASLFSAYDRASDDSRRRAVFAALDAATATPFQGNYPNELQRLTLQDATHIVKFAVARASEMSYELRQHLEHRFHHDYERAQQLVADPGNRFQSQSEAQALATAILEFRDAINTDENFIRYKVLVGFESVYPGHWEHPREFDFQQAEEFRHAEATRYIQEITPANEAQWFGLIARCAQTRSKDLATFPIFFDFLTQLAESRPEVADRLLAGAPESLHRFLAAFLTGLGRSSQADIYAGAIERELQSGRNLTGIAQHLRQTKSPRAGIAQRLLARSIESVAVAAVIECLILAIERFGADLIEDPDTYVREALRFLNDREEVRWIRHAWFLSATAPFYEGISATTVDLLLQNLTFIRRIEPQSERILQHLAARYLEKVWDYFGARLTRDRDEDDDSQSRYEAVPYRFFGLEKELSKDPELAVRKGSSWFTQRAELFEFRGGRLLRSTFPDCSPPFAEALGRVVREGGDSEASFALAILANYDGATAIHGVLKEIVAKFPEDERKMQAVAQALNKTGVVSGELGFANAWRERKQSMNDWLTDERVSVREFAEAHIAKLDLMIADEQRRAEAIRAMYVRQFEEPDAAADDDESSGEPGQPPGT